MQEGKMVKDEAQSGTVAKVVIETGIKSIKGTGTGKGTKKATEAKTEVVEATPKVSSSVLEFVMANRRHFSIFALESVIPNVLSIKNMTNFAYLSTLDNDNNYDILLDLLKLFEE